MNNTLADGVDGSHRASYRGLAFPSIDAGSTWAAVRERFAARSLIIVRHFR
jgi:hypothetical protein